MLLVGRDIYKAYNDTRQTPERNIKVNENETPEIDTETPSEPTNSISRKALILAGAVTGIIIAGGFAFLKKNSAAEELEVDEDLDVAIVDEPVTDTDQN